MFHRIHAALGLVIVLGMASATAPAQDRRPAQTLRFASMKGKAVELVGHLRRPDGAGQFPAVVLLHGCAGDWRGMDSRWGARLVKMGYVALSLDSYGPRGIESVCQGGEPFDRLFDAYAALDFLEGQPFVRSNHIALMGVSAGATLALEDVERGFVENKFKRKFDAAIALYPSCAAITSAMTAPALILIGERDGLTTAAACRELRRRVGNLPKGRKGSRIRLRVYPSAYHAFDNNTFSVRTAFDGSWLEYDANASAQSVEEIREFLGQYVKSAGP